MHISEAWKRIQHPIKVRSNYAKVWFRWYMNWTFERVIISIVVSNTFTKSHKTSDDAVTTQPDYQQTLKQNPKSSFNYCLHLKPRSLRVENNSSKTKTRKLEKCRIFSLVNFNRCWRLDPTWIMKIEILAKEWEDCNLFLWSWTFSLQSFEIA